MKETLTAVISRTARFTSANFKLLVIGVALIGGLGSVLLAASKASTPNASIEPESGTLTNQAIKTTDASASGGSAVKFTAAPVTPTTPPPTTPTGTLCDGYSNWSDPATWGGSVPAANSVVTIPAAKKVKLDIDVPHFNGINIPSGTELCLPDRPTTLSSKFIAVMGKFSVGNSGNRAKSNIIIKLEGGSTTDSYTISGAAATAISDYNKRFGATLTTSAGTNVLIALNGGVIDLFGEERGTTWTQLATPSAAGATSITLKEAMSWRAGDRIVIASATTDPLAYDDVTITAVSADGKTLSLAKPLTYRHAGTSTCLTTGGQSRCVEERSEVGLLTHNVKITGPDNTPTTRFGGHTMVTNGGTMHIDNTELYSMGQEGVLGRYPLHWHIVGDAGSNSFIRNISTHNNFDRQLSLHGTNNLKVSGMVANDSYGHSVMLENGYEENNVFDHNLVMTTRYEPIESKRLLFTDKVPSAFWITNGNNTLTRNSAAGSEGSGIWYDPTGFGTTDVIGASYADRQPFGILDDNIAHSVKRPVDRDEFTNSHEGGSGIITQSPNSMGDRTGRGTAHNNTVWMNDAGLWIDGGFDFVDTKAANNRVSIANSFGAVRGGMIYIVGTGNTKASEVGAKDDFSGWRFYHGAGDIDDMWIGGLNNSYNAYGNNDNSASASDADNRIRGIRYFGAGNPTYPTNYRTMLCFNFEWCTNPQSSHWIIDLDGSVLGTGDPSTPTGRPQYLFKNQLLQQNASQDKTLYSNINFNYDGPVKADLTRYRPLATKDEGTMRLRFGEEDAAKKTLTRDDGVSDKAFLPALLNGRTYTITSASGGNLSSLDFDWSGSPPSLVKLVIPWSGGTPSAKAGYSCSGGARPMAGSLAAINTTGGWYYDAGAKKIYVSLQSNGTVPAMGYGGWWQSGNNYWCFN